MSQYGQTISIKHFLNKKVKGRIVEAEGPFSVAESPFPVKSFSYPLYVRITVRRQMTEIKSLLNTDSSDDEFEMLKSHYSIAVQKEIDLIAECIHRENPFAQDRFSLKKALSNFQFENQPIGQLVNHYLLDDLKNSLTVLAKQAAQRRLEFREADYYYAGIQEIFDEHGLNKPDPEKLAREDINIIDWGRVNVGNLAAWWMESPNTPMYQLYHSYPEEFWLFQQYSRELTNTPDYLYTLKDWINGNYQKNFMYVWRGHPDPKRLLARITTGFEVLIQKHIDLQWIVAKQTVNVMVH